MGVHPIVHVELSSSDFDTMKRFYGGLFGWQFEDYPESNYVSFNAGDGVSPGGGFNAVGEQNPAGTVLIYIGTDDLKATIAEAEKLGAKIIVPSQEVPGMGAFGIIIDPSGNQVGLWEAAEQM